MRQDRLRPASLSRVATETDLGENRMELVVSLYLPQLPGVAIEEEMGATVGSIEATQHRFIFGKEKMFSGDTCYQRCGRQSEERKIHQKGPQSGEHRCLPAS